MDCGIEDRKGKCQLKTILTNSLAVSEEVVRWCEYCGAIVIDEDCDGRTNPGQIRAMEFPSISKENK